MRFIAELFNLMAIVLHRRLRGDVDIVWIKTDKIVELAYDVKGASYIFRSEQYKYLLISNGWLKTTRTKYAYSVKLLVEPNGEPIDKTFGIYGSQCPRFMKNSTYPHRLAINAHLKRVILPHRADCIVIDENIDIQPNC